MVTKAIVEDIITQYQIRVRIPFYDGISGARGATAAKDLSLATICSLPNTINHIQKNDIVFISFEDDDISKPVIIGYLSKESGAKSLIDLTVQSLTTSGATTLSENTCIGEVSPFELKQLKNVNGNVQLQLDQLRTAINNLQTTINNL